MPRKTRYELGFSAGVEAAAKFLATANVSPPDAKLQWGNAAGAIRMMAERGHISASKDQQSPTDGASA